VTNYNSKTSTGFKSGAATSYILEGISLDIEARYSDFAELSIRGLLEAGILLVNLDEDNVRDLVLSRDITLNANLEISNISSDRRALRESNSFYLSQVTYSSPIQLRVFNINDVL